MNARTSPIAELSWNEARAALALAEAIIPGSARVPAADEATVERAAAVVRRISPEAAKVFSAAQRVLDLGAIASTGKPFHALDANAQEALLRAWQSDSVFAMPLVLVTLVYKMTHFDREPVYAALGGVRNHVERLEQPRWLEQIHRAADWRDGDLDCDVVVVGTGAGGAVVGKKLADRGHAVVFIEEGEHHRRDAFDGSSIEAHFKFYRVGVTLGAGPMPIFMGKLVGGSTAVNGGSCFRTPDRVLHEWCESIGTDELSPDAMRRHFEEVEGVLQVAPAEPRRIGPIADVIARGCESLGWSHHPMLRNAPGCEGQGFCDFGCRTDARRSTNLSYVPLALERGAMLLTGLRAERLILENGRAVGVEGVASDGSVLRVRARRVVFAGGGIPTPAFLLKQGVANRSGQLGRNLSIQPSTGFAARVEDRVDGPHHIPQGYFLDQFLSEGILINGGLPDYAFAPLIFALGGRRLMTAIDELEHMAAFALLSRDTSQPGRVRLGPKGTTLVTYSIAPEDVARLHRATVLAGRLCLAAGARRLYPQYPKAPILEGAADLRRFEQMRVGPGDTSLVSYHPVGTCRMGLDPAASVVGIDHEVHDVPGLHVVDGSSVPGPTGVNPQITIMAMANRAAERIDQRLG